MHNNKSTKPNADMQKKNSSVFDECFTANQNLYQMLTLCE